jgi:hypothetical protein
MAVQDDGLLGLFIRARHTQNALVPHATHRDVVDRGVQAQNMLAIECSKPMVTNGVMGQMIASTFDASPSPRFFGLALWRPLTWARG